MFCSAVRFCQKTCTIDGVTILKGSHLVIPIYVLHHSPEYWEEPDQFRPERFASKLVSFSILSYSLSLFYPIILRFHPDEKAKRHPLAHMPFGLGPRNCVGMRFALMEAKMALLTILRRFKFERSPDTEVQYFLDCICLELEGRLSYNYTTDNIQPNGNWDCLLIVH